MAIHHELCLPERCDEGKGAGGGNDTIVSASVRVNEVTTIAAAAESPRPPVEISQEFGRSRHPSPDNASSPEGTNDVVLALEPTATQLLVGSAVAVACRVSILLRYNAPTTV